mgnify:CR=1 FL=1
MLKNEPATGDTNALLPLDAKKINNLVVLGENELVKSLVLFRYAAARKQKHAL